MRQLASLLVLVLVLAGCSGGGDEPQGADDQVKPTGATAVDKGAVAGLVVDSEGLPVEGASVLLSQPAAATPLAAKTTDAGGRFAFDLLEPDAYRLTASAASYRSTSIILEVEAGQSLSVTLVVEKDVTREPFHFTLVQTGQLSCAAAAVVLPTAGACAQDANEHTVFFQIPDGFALLVGEATWDNAEEELALYLLEDNRTAAQANGTAANATLGEAWGPPGVRVELRPGQQNAGSQEGLVEGVPYGPVPARAFQLNATAFYAGLFASEVDSAASAVCSNVYGRCAGVGATVTLRFDVHVTIFMHREPGDAASFTALPES